MGRKLDRISIKGFKSIRELQDFELLPLNIIIGGNGAGKSNFIELFRVISAMMKRDGLKEYIEGTADSFLFGGPKQTKEISVQLVFGSNGYDFELAPTADGFFLINNEKRHYFPHDATRNLGSGNFNPNLLSDKDNSGLVSEKGASYFTYEAITSWTIYHFHDTSKEAGMRRYCDDARGANLFSDASNIAAFLHNMQQEHPDSYREIISAVQLVMPFFEDFVLMPNSKGQVRLEWKQTGLRDYTMRPTHLSDGSIRFICLVTSLLQPDPPSLMIIDEPEIGLHPAAIEILSEVIQTAASRTQVIIATQSPHLIDHFSVEDIVVANRENGATTLRRLEHDAFAEWLKSYTIGELWMKNVIVGGPSYE